MSDDVELAPQQILEQCRRAVEQRDLGLGERLVPIRSGSRRSCRNTRPGVGAASSSGMGSTLCTSDGQLVSR